MLEGIYTRTNPYILLSSLVIRPVMNSTSYSQSYSPSYLPYMSIMLMVGLLVSIASVSVHYRTSMRIEQAKVLEVVESQARLIAAVARFDSIHSSNDHPLGAKEATLSQLFETLSRRESSSDSGENLLAHRNKQLELVLDYSPDSINLLQPLSGVSALALNLALDGGSGTVFGIDHRGQSVLAAYAYIPDLDRGLVAKVDMSELREPFIYASLIATALSIITVALGSILFKQIQQLKTSPNRARAFFDKHSGIKEYERFFYLLIVLAIICITVNIGSAIALYHSSYDRSQDYLLSLVDGQVRLIESVSVFDAQYSQQDHSQGAKGATLSQVIDAYSSSPGFGETGEYLLGQKSGDFVEIVFHQRHRHLPDTRPIFSSNEAEAMRQALQGNTGILVATDYLGIKVLAAHAPLKQLEYGLVAKIDIAELRAPFIRGTIVTGSIALCIIIFASVLLARMTKPFQELSMPLQETHSSATTNPTPISLIVFTSGLVLGIFTFDIFSPQGVTSSALYVSAIAMGWWFPQRRQILILAAIVSILTLAVFFFSPWVEEWKSIINRCYSLFVIWVTALTLNLAKASDVARELQANSLKTLSLAVEFSPTGVMITDPSGSIEYANPRFVDNTEYSTEDIIGHNPKILNSGETPKSVIKDMWETINSGKEWRGEIINRKKCGELYWEDTAIFPILSEQGEVLNFVCLKENITERKQAESDLQYKATHDSLTSLPNAHLGKDRLKKAIAKARRDQDITAVLFIDLDGFKTINDNFGHKAGDLVLQEVAARIKGVIREVDTVARIGGDEFLVILGSIQATENAEAVALKIINAISQPYSKIEHHLDIPTDKTIGLGSSIGISLYPEHAEEVDQLIKYSDAAMYSIKRGGKNNYCIYQSSCNL